MAMSVYFLLLFISVLSFVLSYFFTIALEEVLRREGKTVPDVHKREKPMVPRPGGPAIFISLLIPALILFLLNGDRRILGVLILASIGFFIGLCDDFKRLGGREKVLLLTLPGIALVLSGIYFPKPILPFIGVTRLTIIYPVLLVLASTIVANGVNMIDIFNGLVSSVMMISTIPILLASIMRNDLTLAFLSVIFLCSLIGFLLRHRYPSKIFPGDSGAMLMGLFYLGLVVEGRMEVIGIVALLPVILNGFLILSTIGGFIEHSNIAKRPVSVVLRGGGEPLLISSKEEGAPITLARLVVSREGLTERDVVLNIVLLSIFSSILAIATIFIGELA